MALRQERRALLADRRGVPVPALLIVSFSIISQMVLAFRMMQTRIDAVNRILREQIMGIRVVRAFVREPMRDASASGSPTPGHATNTAVTAGPLDGGDVPEA